MYRTAVVTTSSDNTDLYPSIVTAWEAAAFGGAAPAVSLARLQRITVDVSAACWIMFRRDNTVQPDVFFANPGDAVAINIADAGLPIHQSTAYVSTFMVTRSDGSAPVSVRVTGEVTV